MVVFHFSTKGGKVGENWNKVACCGYPPAVASTQKNELIKIHLKWWISSQSALLGYFYLRLEIARALLDMKSVLLPPPPLSTSTPGCRFRFPNFTQAAFVARFCDARAVSAAQNKRFHGPNWAAVHPGRTELILLQAGYKYTTGPRKCLILYERKRTILVVLTAF